MSESWRARVLAEPVDAEWLRWWRRSWRATAAEVATKARVTRMTVHRWEQGITPIPDHIAAWLRAVLPAEPALPYPGMPDVTMEPATDEERREFAELALVQWSKPRKRRTA